MWTQLSCGGTVKTTRGAGPSFRPALPEVRCVRTALHQEQAGLQPSEGETRSCCAAAAAGSGPPSHLSSCSLLQSLRLPGGLPARYLHCALGPVPTGARPCRLPSAAAAQGSGKQAQLPDRHTSGPLGAVLSSLSPCRPPVRSWGMWEPVALALSRYPARLCFCAGGSVREGSLQCHSVITAPAHCNKSFRADSQSSKILIQCVFLIVPCK